MATIYWHNTEEICYIPISEYNSGLVQISLGNGRQLIRERSQH